MDIYLVDNSDYTFNIYQESFAKSEPVIIDSDDNIVTNYVTNVWAFKSGKEYTGTIRREDGRVFAGATESNGELQKKRIEFTPLIGDNLNSDGVAYIENYSGETEYKKKMVTHGSRGDLVNPGRQHFRVVFTHGHGHKFNHNQELMDNFLSDMIPAGLLASIHNTTTTKDLTGETILIS